MDSNQDSYHFVFHVFNLKQHRVDSNQDPDYITISFFMDFKFYLTKVENKKHTFGGEDISTKLKIQNRNTPQVTNQPKHAIQNSSYTIILLPMFEIPLKHDSYLNIDLDEEKNS